MAHWYAVLDELGTDALHTKSHSPEQPPLFGFAGFFVDTHHSKGLARAFMQLKQATLPSISSGNLISYQCDGTDLFINHFSESGLAAYQKDRTTQGPAGPVLGLKHRLTLDQRIACATNLLDLLTRHNARMVYFAITKRTRPAVHGKPVHINTFMATEAMKRLDAHCVAAGHQLSLLYDFHTIDARRKQAQRAHLFDVTTRQPSALYDLPAQGDSQHSPTIQLADWISGLVGRWLAYHTGESSHVHLKVYDDLFGQSLRRLSHPTSTFDVPLPPISPKASPPKPITNRHSNPP